MRPYFLALFLIAATGFCTGQYVETGPSYVDGLIQRGDVFEYYCEFPDGITELEPASITVTYPNAEIIQHFTGPRLIFGTSLVVYP